MRSQSTIIVVKCAMVTMWLIVIGSSMYFPIVMNIFASQKTITVFTWTDLISSEQIKIFEKRTGIRVNLRYFENNEELFIKMLAGRGEGFDVIIPSDYVVPKLIENQLIKKVEKSKLTFWQNLNPRLLGAYYDPHNLFSIPYHWAIYGIGIRTDLIKNYDRSSGWRMLFENSDTFSVAMLNSARESFGLASLYLFNSVELLNDQQIKLAQELLQRQRSFVESYVDGDMRVEYLLRSGQVGVGVMASSFTMTMLKQNEMIDFFVPSQGSFMIIDNIVISASTKKDDYIYSFINFLFEPSVIEYNFKNCTFVPTTYDLPVLLDTVDAPKKLKEIYTDSISHLYFFRSILPEQQLSELWIKMKLASL